MTFPIAQKTVDVLIIDDDEDDFLIIKDYIARIVNTQFTVNWCSGYAEGVAAICSGNYDIYFVDFLLGPKTGLDLIREVQRNNCEEPIILLTGAGNKEIDLQAMQAGASDYLVKSDLNTEKLDRCIRYAVSRHEFLQALKANEQKYRGVFEKSKDFIFIASENLSFTAVNQVGAQLLGYSQEEMLKIGLYDILEDGNSAKAIESELREGVAVIDWELNLVKKNKQLINSVLSVSKEKDADGRIYMQGIVHDITALKNAEKATLQTSRLKATERLVRMLAHEVRNPLNNIILAVDHFNSPDFLQEKVYVDIIERNCTRINTLISELLNASRPALIALQKVSLQSVLSKSVGSAMDRIVLKEIALRQDYSPNEAWIMADPDKLCIAFLNIIINGIEAIPAENARLDVQLKEERDYYRVSITDNGHGISEENLGQLFEPYYTSKTGGMGLGLSSALSIFESHRALVDVKSKLNQGTSFSILFRKA